MFGWVMLRRSLLETQHPKTQHISLIPVLHFFGHQMLERFGLVESQTQLISSQILAEEV